MSYLNLEEWKSYLSEEEDEEQQAEGLAGINAVAQKWMRRNGLSASQLSSLFSLDLDDIDLVAASVPGKNNRQRLRSVALLKGVAC